LTTSTPSGRRLDDDVPDLIIKAARFGSDEDVALSDADDKIVVCQSQRNVS